MTYSDIDTSTVVSLVTKAGKFVREGFTKNLEEKGVSSKDAADPNLTEYDLLSEKIIIEGLRKAFPDIPIISEEAGAIGTPSDDVVWIIDPIDGTGNFITGRPYVRVSVALAQHNETLLSIVYDPLSDSLYRAEKGKGAFKNDKKIVPRSKDTPTRNIGLDIAGGRRDEELLLFPPMRLQNLRVYNDSSSISMMTLVADGVYQGGILAHAKIWDYAPYLLVEESGGVVSNWKGEPFDLRQDRVVIARDAAVQKELLGFIKGVGLDIA